MTKQLRDTAEDLNLSIHAIAANLYDLAEHGIISKEDSLQILDHIGDFFILWCVQKMGLDDAEKFFAELNKEGPQCTPSKT